MATNHRSIVRLSVLALGALLVGLPAAARAAEPTTPQEAATMAQHYREQAARYRALGGFTYKTGSVQRAEADAARYSALADELAAPAVATPVLSPEAEHYAELAARYRALGGPAYKTGAVQWAEAQQQRYETAAVAAAPSDPQAGSMCLATKAVVRTMACSRE